MKNKFLKLVPLVVLFLIFSGCSLENFFDINSSIESPMNMHEQKNILNCVKDYMQEDFSFKYALYKGKYHSCIVGNFEASDLQGESFALFFCSESSSLNKIHILFLKNEDGKWNVFKDVKHLAGDIEKVYIQDVDEDGNNEFAFILKGLDKKRDNVYTYRYSNGNIEKINISQEFFNNFKDND